MWEGLMGEKGRGSDVIIFYLNFLKEREENGGK